MHLLLQTPPPSLSFKPNTLSVSLDGMTQWIDVGTGPNAIVNAGSTWSMSAWVNFTNTSNFTIFSTIGGTSTGPFPPGVIMEYFTTSGTGLLALAGSPTSGFAIPFENATTLTPSVWISLIYTCTGATGTHTDYSMYINGVAQVVGTLSDSPPYASGIPTLNVLIGNNQSVPALTTGPFQGNMSDVAIYNQVLSSGDVTAIYNGGAPPNLQSLASASALVSWWRFNGNFADVLGNNNGTGIASPTFTASVP